MRMFLQLIGRRSITDRGVVRWKISSGILSDFDKWFDTLGEAKDAADHISVVESRRVTVWKVERFQYRDELSLAYEADMSKRFISGAI